jgi:hypothetical protein
MGDWFGAVLLPIMSQGALEGAGEHIKLMGGGDQVEQFHC